MFFVKRKTRTYVRPTEIVSSRYLQNGGDNIRELQIGLIIEEVAEMIGIGRNTMRKLVDSGRLPVFKEGRKTIIRRVALENFLIEIYDRRGEKQEHTAKTATEDQGYGTVRFPQQRDGVMLLCFGHMQSFRRFLKYRLKEKRQKRHTAFCSSRY